MSPRAPQMWLAESEQMIQLVHTSRLLPPVEGEIYTNIIKVY